MRNGWAIIHTGEALIGDYYLAASRSARQCVAHVGFLAGEHCGELARSVLLELEEFELDYEEGWT